MKPAAALKDNNFTRLSTSPSGLQVAASGTREASFPEISQLVFASYNRFKTTFTSVVLAAILFGFGAFYLFPAQYVGSSSIRILQRESYLLTTQQTRSEDAAFVRAQSALVVQDQTLALALTDKRLVEIVDRYEIEDATDWLKNQIKVEIASGSDIMNVVALHQSPTVAAHASRAVTQSYLASITQQLRSNREKRIKELENTASEVDEKLMQQWKLLQSKAIETGSGTPQSLSVHEQLKIQDLRENSQRLRTLEEQRSQLEMQLATERNVKTAPSALSLESCIRDALNQHPEAISLREQIRQCELKIQKLLEIVQNKNAPQLVKLQNEKAYYVTALSQVEEKIEAIERQRINNLAATRSISPKVEEIEQRLKLLDGELNHLRESTTEIESSIAVSNGSSGVELEIIRHEIDRQEKLADQLWKTIQELRIEERAEPRVALMSLPGDTVRLSRAKQIKAVAAAAVIGCLAAILGVGFIEWSSCIIRTPSDVQERAKMRVYGFSKTGNPSRFFGLKGHFAVKSAGEGAKEIVAQLLLAAGSKPSLPSLLISSASNEDSRGNSAIDIAAALSQSGRSAIIVACENSPLLSSSTDPLSKTKAQANRSNQPIYTSSVFGCEYLQLEAAQDDSNWLTAHSLPVLLAELALHYEAILVLGPPILTNPASLLIGKSVELTLLVGKIGSTRSDDLSAARELLESANCNVLGTLVTPSRSCKHGSTVPIRKSKSVRQNEELMHSKEIAVLTAINELQGQVPQLDQAQLFHPPHAQPAPVQSSSRILNRTPE